MITTNRIAPHVLAQDEQLLADIRAGYLEDPASIPSLPEGTASLAAAYLLRGGSGRRRAIARAAAADIELCEQTADVIELAHLAATCKRAGCWAAGERLVALPGTRDQVLCTRHAARRIRRVLARGAR